MNRKRKGILSFLPYLLVVGILSYVIGSTFLSEGNSITTYQQFKSDLSTLTINDVEVETWSTVLEVRGTALNQDNRRTSIRVTIPNTDENVKELNELLVNKNVEINYTNGPNKLTFGAVLSQMLPIIILIIGIMFMMSRMGGSSQAMEITKSKARREENIKTRFEDVAGCDEEIEEVKEVVDYLKHPGKYRKVGARVPKGILMVGPPGTGKTLLAKAVAGESNVPFYSISGSDFSEMFVGVGAGRVRAMFKQAKATAPCIIFIDEIDAVGLKRGMKISGSEDQTLNQILVEMDGMDENNGVVVIAATNRADVLDPALLRSGRFDRQIKVALPDKKGRLEILQVHARNKKLEENIDLENIAKRTPGFSGADLENVLNEGAILAVRENREIITIKDLDEAIDRVMMGPAKKSRKYSDEEKKLVAYHEAGHAVIGIKLKDAPKVRKITIIPRGDAGGYNLMLPEVEKYLSTKKSLEAQIVSYMGGRVAENLIFNDISAGASGDIQEATRIAKYMVTIYGMSKLGPVQYVDTSTVYYTGGDSSMSGYSQAKASEIDSEVLNIINGANSQAEQIISENMDLLHLIANTLLEEETITEEEIQSLVEYGTLKPEVNQEITE